MTFLCIRNVLCVFPEAAEDGVSVATATSVANHQRLMAQSSLI